MSNRLDVILFGCTGLVGRYGVEFLHELATKRGLTWGVAGRDKVKIKAVLDKLNLKSANEIPIIVADMYDEESLRAMTSRTKVLINSCGPLRRMGENVVRSCIDTKTHYVDISAEENYIHKIALEYHEKAQRAGVYIVSSCGYDTNIYEQAVTRLQEKFPGTVNSIECYVNINAENMKGHFANVSTWNSTVDLTSNQSELKALQEKVFKNKYIPKLKPELKLKKLPFRVPVDEGWGIPLPSSDRTVMVQTQLYNFENKGTRPIQIQNYFVLQKLWHFFFGLFFSLIFLSLVRFKFGRSLLLKYPSFFSCGFYGEPTEEMCLTWPVRLTLVGKGWKNKSIGPEEKYSEKPDHCIILRNIAPGAAYVCSGLCLVLSGVIIASEPSVLPEKYGVYPPGVVFNSSSMGTELEKHGYTFDVIEEFDI